MFWYYEYLFSDLTTSNQMNISLIVLTQTNLGLDILLDNSNVIQHPEIKNPQSLWVTKLSWNLPHNKCQIRYNSRYSLIKYEHGLITHGLTNSLSLPTHILTICISILLNEVERAYNFITIALFQAMSFRGVYIFIPMKSYRRNTWKDEANSKFRIITQVLL